MFCEIGHKHCVVTALVGTSANTGPCKDDPGQQMVCADHDAAYEP